MLRVLIVLMMHAICVANVQRAIHVDTAVPVDAPGMWTDCGASFGRPVAYTYGSLCVAWHAGVWWSVFCVT